MYYQLVERTNPLDREGEKKLYATPRYVGSVTAAKLAKQIAAQTTLTPGDVSNVLDTFLDLLPMYLLMGVSVELKGIGRMRITFSSEGINAPKDFKVNLVRQVRVLFLSSPDLRKRINQEITFEKQPEKK